PASRSMRPPPLHLQLAWRAPCNFVATYPGAKRPAKNQTVAAPRMRGAKRGWRRHLEMIGPARLGRLHPVLPDRAAPRAAGKQQPNSEHTDDDRPTPPHWPPAPPLPILSAQLRPFQAAGAAGSFRNGPIWARQTLNRGKETS